MKIQVVSDLHLEFSDISIQNAGEVDVLILSGDIMIAQDLHDHPQVSSIYEYGAFAELGRKQKRVQTYRDFIKRCSDRFPHVIYVAGNHEFYHGKWYKTIDYLDEECAQYSNVHFLEDDTFTLDNVVFVGGTLWTDMNRGDPITLNLVKNMMNDFRLIRNDRAGFIPLKPADTVARHQKTRDYIKQVASENKDKKVVVVGHHSPSFQSCHEQYRGEKEMNGCYHSDLSDVMLDYPHIRLWTHGHTHHAFDYVIGETRVICNPRGYETYSSKEHTGWDPNKIVEI